MVSEPGNVLITGSTGMVGQAISKKLRDSGYTVFSLSRTDKDSPFYYEQAQQIMHLSDKIPLQGVINLAGAGISEKRWNKSRKNEIRDSRLLTTELLCRSLAQLPSRPEFLLSASAIGFYGDTGDRKADEHDPSGSDFLARLSVDWEDATTAASAAGIRTVHMRFGLVLSTSGGVLKNFILPMKLAAVGRVGDGQQFMSWISIDDAVRIIEKLIDSPSFSGPVNLVADKAITNAEFMRQLSRALRRPGLPPLPAFIVRILFGEMADAALLLSSNISSRRMAELGIELAHPTLPMALDHLLK